MAAAHFEPAAQPHRHEPEIRRRSKMSGFVILLVVFAFMSAAGLVFWRHRPVSITVDGEMRTVFKRSTIGNLYDDKHPSVTPGNLVSVAGNVIGEGQGNPFTCVVNGTQYSYEEAVNLRLWGDETVDFANGDDVMEEYTTEVTEMAPKLEFHVQEGTPEKGYMVQQGTIQYISQWGSPGVHEVRHGAQSGEAGDGEVIEPAQNCVVSVQNIHPANDEKLVALTFDDGPSYYTRDYLSILAENEVPATFCIIGDQVGDGQQVIAETSSAGHLIASHTWDHQQLTTLDAEQVKQEIGDASNALEGVTGAPATFIRPPYGDLDNEVWLKSGGLMSASMYWTHDSLDWERPGVDAIVKNATDFMFPGSVILMHDGGGDRSQDVEALPRIISAWKEAGYRFVTVRDLLASDPTVVMPEKPADFVWPTQIAEEPAASEES